jgi:membrane protease YdiL (CAAX protease family)
MNSNAAQVVAAPRAGDQMTSWSWLSLVLALFLVPGLALGNRWLGRPGGNEGALLVELGMFALAGSMLWIVRAKEGKSWESLGLGRARLGQTALLSVGLFVAVAAALGALLAVLSALGIPALQGDDIDRPLWLLAVMCFRAGTLEELTYRAVAIDRVALLTKSKTLAWLLPALLFGALHYPQGLSGILIAIVAALVLSACFLWKRNLWANMSVHFLVDFIPNVVLPLLGLAE